MDFPSSADIIHDFEQLSLRLNWTVLRIGHEGQRFLPRIVSADAIARYAEQCFAVGSIDAEALARLILPDCETDFIDALSELSQKEHIAPALQERKLRLYAIAKELDSLPEDETNALLALTDAWVSLGLPIDGPHIVQGCGNTITPQEYYTREMYHKLLEKHRQWIAEELQHIRRLEDGAL